MGRGCPSPKADHCGGCRDGARAALRSGWAIRHYAPATRGSLRCFDAPLTRLRERRRVHSLLHCFGSGLFSSGFTVERIPAILFRTSNQNGAPSETATTVRSHPMILLAHAVHSLGIARGSPTVQLQPSGTPSLAISASALVNRSAAEPPDVGSPAC